MVKLSCAKLCQRKIWVTVCRVGQRGPKSMAQTFACRRIWVFVRIWEIDFVAARGHAQAQFEVRGSRFAIGLETALRLLRRACTIVIGINGNWELVIKMIEFYASGRQTAIVLMTSVLTLMRCSGSDPKLSGSTTGGAGGALSNTGGAGGAANSGGTKNAGGNTGGSSTAGGGTGTSQCWRPFNDQSPWNTPIAPDAAVDPDSATMIADFSSISGQTQFWINIQDYSVPVYWVDSSTPTVAVNASLGGTGFRTGAASDSVAAGTGMAPIPTGATAAAGTDRHLAIIDRNANMEWGFWDAAPGSTGWTAGEASTLDLSGTGVRPPERNNPWWAGHGPRACGYGLINGLIMAQEFSCGAIEHALVVAYPHIRSRYYTPPASTAQGTTTDAIATRGILCGGRIQLDPALDITTLGLSKSGLIIAKALQKYGAYVGDYSGAVSLYADASESAQQAYASGDLTNGSAQGIALNRFRVLQIGTSYDNGN